ncbi:hypothetical protein K450DRAFT_260755 [Umbelopsis ramanniana AG]|uniref:Uncharacterized protein n=1 Tax=Umbelopsis ramanniana AG TaxID=1314678 RepID=A0AAD5E2F6_UMBRA|nr:uncharacterized protein K450DRAFT_260755 [Umbelopsis ramanniana AG]KAI8575632.1 hypothetical protein K450DRAFT_260755 [Umbelopsis ramanniana AG]
MFVISKKNGGCRAVFRLKALNIFVCCPRFKLENTADQANKYGEHSQPLRRTRILQRNHRTLGQDSRSANWFKIAISTSKLTIMQRATR